MALTIPGMLNQGTHWGRLDDWCRESAGMLRRRVSAATIVRVIAIGVAFGALGANALASGDATALLIGVVLLLTIQTALRRQR